MMYFWEPCGPYYHDSVLAEQTMGTHYDVLQVEQSNEGWHGLILMLDYSGWSSMGDLLDEKVFDSKYEAVQWVEERDSKAAAKNNKGAPTTEDDAEYWEAVLSHDDSTY